MNDFKKGVLLGCVFALILIFLGSVIRDSIRVGVLSDCIQNGKTVVYGNEWFCSFKQESR